MLALDPRLGQLLADPTNPVMADRINRFLEGTARVIDASDIYLLDAQGTTLAASNWNLPRSFIGQNYAFRPYFTRAMSGQAGRYFALGVASGQRGYYFSWPVSEGDEIVGVVVVKIPLDGIESRWQNPFGQNERQIRVLDEFGVVVLATRSDWRLRKTRALTDAELERLVRERRYPVDRLDVLPARSLALPDGLDSARTRLLQIDNDGRRERYLVQSADMPQAGWTVEVLSPLREARREVTSVIWFTVTVVMIMVLMVMLLIERYRRALVLEQARRELEHRVEERTQDLTRTNRQLREEIEERHRAEAALKQAQEELIQTAKLAVLGQLSAGINHEINQPLTAIRNYAQNARRFQERGQAEMVNANLDEIVSLCDHIAKIIAQLKIFARKSEGVLSPVPVKGAVEAALRIVEPHRHAAQVTVEVNGLRDEDYVLGDLVRLEQILVNLLTNAIQAVAGQPEACVSIEVGRLADQIHIRVKDNGGGIEPGQEEQIFEPFYTTKGVSQGLGLGLAISRRIAESMQGALRAFNSEQGGACFELTLKRFDTETLTDHAPE
ncbi:MAG: sensor histidine kinase [Gammaproteobacteria bacterium]|nr:MAG: sensor histidine kinase [Gammaproteobacteria bacterium]